METFVVPSASVISHGFVRSTTFFWYANAMDSNDSNLKKV